VWNALLSWYLFTAFSAAHAGWERERMALVSRMSGPPGVLVHTRTTRNLLISSSHEMELSGAR